MWCLYLGLSLCVQVLRLARYRLDEPRQTEVAALYERWAKERYQLLREHHAEMASQSHPVPYIARVRADDVMDNPPSSE